jgi:hypothetical protein
MQNLLSSTLVSKNLKTRVYRTIILPVLYGCETWCVTLRDEHRLRVFENRVLRRMFRFNRDGVTAEWRRLHDEKLYSLCCTLNISRVIKSRKMKWAGHVGRMGDRSGACRVLVWRPDRRRPLGRPRHRWEDNIKMDLQALEWGGIDWIDLAEDMDSWRTLVKAVMNLRVP